MFTTHTCNSNSPRLLTHTHVYTSARHAMACSHLWWLLGDTDGLVKTAQTNSSSTAVAVPTHAECACVFGSHDSRWWTLRHDSKEGLDSSWPPLSRISCNTGHQQHQTTQLAGHQSLGQTPQSTTRCSGEHLVLVTPHPNCYNLWLLLCSSRICFGQTYWAKAASTTPHVAVRTCTAAADAPGHVSTPATPATPPSQHDFASRCVVRYRHVHQRLWLSAL